MDVIPDDTVGLTQALLDVDVLNVRKDLARLSASSTTLCSAFRVVGRETN